MDNSILVTAAEEDAEEIKSLLESKGRELKHFPLERYVPVADRSDIKNTLSRLTEFENIIYGSLRNARFFMQAVCDLGKKEELKKRLNLTLDEETATYLEESQVPAVCTYAGGKSIKLVEFMMRLRRMGATLYPCGSHRKEEIPGFLVELDIPVKELELFDLVGPGDGQLEDFRGRLNEHAPGAIIFHSRRSVNRTLAAFPELDFSSSRIITADKGVTKKLSEKGIEADEEAEGNWKSIAELL